jgi:HK97 family phage major capsid protein
MNKHDMLSRLADIADQLETMDADNLTEEDATRFDELAAEADELRDAIDKAEARAKQRAAVADAVESRTVGFETGDAATVNVNVRQSDPYDLDGLPAYGPGRAAEVRGRALDVVASNPRFARDAHRANATRLLERIGGQPGVAELILLRSSDRYAQAFYKRMAGSDDLTSDERAVLAQVKDLQRAMSLSDVTGVLVPSQLDTTVIISNDGTRNPFRQVSRVETGTTNVFTGVTSAGITASWDGEGVEVSDDAPSFANPTATAYKGSAFVPISYEAFEDARGRESDIVNMIVDAKDRLESTAFATGNGTAAPRGIVTALDANTNVEVETTTSNVFGLVDVYNLLEQLPPRWRMDATFAANLNIINDIRQFGTDSLSTQTVDLTADGLTRVLGKPVVESSAMDGTVAAGGEDNILVIGDFAQYLIYDRLGLSVEFVPNLFGTTNARPTGQRGWMAHWRTGANTQVDTAFRILQAHTNS